MYTVQITYVDAYGRTGKKSIEVLGATLNEVKDNAMALVGAFENITDGGVQSARITVPLNVAQGTPGAGCNRDEGITFACLLAGGEGKRGSIKIPAPKTSYLDAYGNVDLAAAEVAAFLDMFTGAIIIATISDGDYVSLVTKGTLDR